MSGCERYNQLIAEHDALMTRYDIRINGVNRRSRAEQLSVLSRSRRLLNEAQKLFNLARRHGFEHQCVGRLNGGWKLTQSSSNSARTFSYEASLIGFRQIPPPVKLEVLKSRSQKSPKRTELQIQREFLDELNRCHREWSTAMDVDRRHVANAKVAIALKRFTAAFWARQHDQEPMHRRVNVETKQQGSTISNKSL